MIAIELTGQLLVVRMQGLDRFFALRGRVECALVNVRGVTVGVPTELRQLPFRATRKVGTRLVLGDSRIIMGSFGTLGDGDYFYAVRAAERAITIALEHEPYRALIVEVPDPAGMAGAIAAAAAGVAGRPPAGPPHS